MAGFTKATRRMSRLRVALCGTAGSGKTTSALLIAKGLGTFNTYPLEKKGEFYAALNS
jgi:cytidylate kinase